MDRLDRMATFARVVEAGSLSAAGRGLGLSLAAVSRQLSSLERDLRAELLVRTTRKIVLTDAGRRFYAQCVRLLREVEDAEASVRSDGAIEGRVVLSTSVTIGVLRIGPMVPGLLAKHPGLRVDLRLEDQLVDLVAEGVDVVFRASAGPPDSASVVARPIGSWGRHVVASPRYLRAHGVPKEPADLAQHDAVVQLLSVAGPPQWRLARGGQEHAVDLRAVYRTNSPLVQRDAAIAGLGLAMLPDWIARDAVARGELRVLLPEYEPPRVELFALHRVEVRDVPRVRAVIDHVRSEWASEAVAGKRARPGRRSARNA